MGAEALLAGAQEMDRVQPLVKRNVAIFKNRTHGNGELFTASGAFPNTLADMRTLFRFGLRFQLVRFANYAAMRTNRAVRPKHLFDVLPRRVFVSELGSK